MDHSEYIPRVATPPPLSHHSANQANVIAYGTSDHRGLNFESYEPVEKKMLHHIEVLMQGSNFCFIGNCIQILL